MAGDQRIRFVYLQALEEGRYAELPGHTYAIGFLRSYADYLGLDSGPMVERYKEEISGLPGAGSLVFPVPEPEGKIPGGLMVVISLLLLALAYGGWYAINNQGQDLLAFWNSLSQQDDAVDTPATPAATVTPVTPATPPAAKAAPDPQARTLSDPNSSDTQRAVDRNGVKPSQPRAVPEPVTEVPLALPSTPAPSGAPVPAPTVQLVKPKAPQVPSDGAATVKAAAGVKISTTPPATRPTTSPAGSTDAGRATPPSSADETVARHFGSGDSVDEDAAPQPPERVALARESNSIPPAPNGALEEDREPQTYGEVNQNARILLKAGKDSWVQVRNQQDNVIFTQVLHEGDVYRVPDIAGLTLLTGNAGGLEILVDDKLAPTLGPVGEVRRDVRLDPESLLSGLTGSN